MHNIPVSYVREAHCRSGVKRVIYVEPYPKSMAANLYPDSIVVGMTQSEGSDFVGFQPFSGIAPSRYVELFSKRERKDAQGRALVWQESSAKFLLAQFAPSYILIESQVLEAFRKELTRLGLATATWGGAADA